MHIQLHDALEHCPEELIYSSTYLIMTQYTICFYILIQYRYIATDIMVRNVHSITQLELLCNHAFHSPILVTR